MCIIDTKDIKQVCQCKNTLDFLVNFKMCVDGSPQGPYEVARQP